MNQLPIYAITKAASIEKQASFVSFLKEAPKWLLRLAAAGALAGGTYGGYKVYQDVKPGLEGISESGRAARRYGEFANNLLDAVPVGTTLGGAGLGALIPYLFTDKEDEDRILKTLFGSGVGGLGGYLLGKYLVKP